jgi:hypothetical protein
MEDIFNIIIHAFNALWNIKHYKNTIEIITPSFTTNDCFISVFITERNGRFIITDGGWISENYYNNSFDNDDEYYLKLFSFYKEQFAIEETESKDKIYYYKSTNKKELIPNIVLEMATFISTVVSSSFIQFQENQDKDLQKRFKSQVNTFLSSSFEKNELKLSSAIDEQYKDIKFNAVLTTGNKVTLYNYVTGTTDFYFKGSLGRSNMNFQLINRTPCKARIHKRITVINNTATGYNLNKLQQYLDLIPEETESEIINWSNKNELLKI